MKVRFLLILVFGLFVSCINGQPPKTEPKEEDPPAATRGARVPGNLGHPGKDSAPTVSVPETAGAGKDFEISVVTSGDGCVSKGETSVVLTETTADVFVYDLTAATKPGIMCTMIFQQFEHKATVRFEKPGEIVIRVWGRRPEEKSAMGSPHVIEKRVTVK